MTELLRISVSDTAFRCFFLCYFWGRFGNKCYLCSAFSISLHSTYRKMSLTRRNFCKISVLTALGLIFVPKRAQASEHPRLRGGCRMEVVRCNCFHDLQGCYLDDPEAGPCTRYSAGDTIMITPDNLERLRSSGRICPQAWSALKPYVMAALSAGETSECAPANLPTQAIISCPDGTRPVIFKLTAV